MLVTGGGLGVVVDGDLVAERHGLAGQDVPGVDLALLPARSCGAWPPRRRRPGPGRCRRRRPCRRTAGRAGPAARRRAPAVPAGRVSVVLRPSRMTVRLAPSPTGASSWIASAGGSSPTQNSSRWIRPLSTPSSRSTSMASVTMPNGPHSHQWSTAGTSTVAGSSAVSRCGVQPAAVQLDLLRLAGQHVDDLHPRRVGVLEVGDLVGEHDRVAAPVAVQQRDGGLVVRREHRGGDRHHRGDAGAGGDEHVPAGDGQVGGEACRSAPGRRACRRP